MGRTLSAMGNGSHPRSALSEQKVGDFRAVHEEAVWILPA